MKITIPWMKLIEKCWCQDPENDLQLERLYPGAGIEEERNQ